MPLPGLLLVAACSEDEATIRFDAGTRDGGDSGAVEQVPSHDEPWLREETLAPGSVTFTEILYASPDGSLEWIELHNPMTLDMDLSGWSLAGGIDYAFPAGTLVAAGGWLVVDADSYDGDLADEGERLELHNNWGRLIDTVAYGDDDPWPIRAAGSGHSLAKIDADAASDHAENWTASAELGGTPGQSNLLDPLEPPTVVELVALDADWRYDASGAPPAGWEEADHDDGDWASGSAPFHGGAAQDAVAATAWVTADNYYGLYLGSADGGDLRLVGEDADGSWTTVEGFDIEVGPQDHLYIAAWEAPWDYGGPQMTIAEVELSDNVIGTSVTTFEWILGPAGGCPGTTPEDPPPDEAALALLVPDAEWAAPAVEAARDSSPWGWATASAFSDGTRYVWADTFSDTSVTNTENTYALFRSVAPLLSSRAGTELPAVPLTTVFRTSFDFDADPATATLALECRLDDGAVVYLNGQEVHRENMPDGPVDADTPAASDVTGHEAYAELATDALRRGSNVLAVELHQAAATDTDAVFACALTATITAREADDAVLLNEVAPGGESPFWVEFAGDGGTTGLVLASSGGGEAPVEAGDPTLVEDVGFVVEAGEVLFLYSADRTRLLDAVRVRDRPRARAEDGWYFPASATPGEANAFDLADDVVIDEIQYAHADGEWIELHNRGEESVDLGGWQLVDGVAYTFPAGTTLAAGGYLVVTDAEWTGRLDNRSDRVLLLDAFRNPADEVRYFDDGRWPAAADGGGSSLELRDPRADNTAAEAWAASEEGDRTEWATYTWRGEAGASAVGPDGTWHELVIGLLDAGEVLIDDIRVIEDPDGAATDLLQEGDFAQGAARWRLLGNHRHSEVVQDPDDPANPVLRLKATGPTGHMHNHAETTLRKAVGSGEYEISYRARWVSGSDRLNARLYFNRLARTMRIATPGESGTPGGPNSTLAANIGPTFADLRQDVAVPAAAQPVRVSVSVDDPDGVEAVTLWSAAGDEAFQSQEMAEGEGGRWEATLEGRAAGTIVQFYVAAADGEGAVATFPAAGPDSRALIQFDDGEAATNGLHNFRILVTGGDSDWMHADENLMSDDLLGATVVYDEAEVFYDVGLRLKGSQRGRPEVPRLGYSVRFQAEHPFRGSHRSVLVDRSEGVGFGQREVLMNLVMTAAGSESGEYNDLAHALTPLPEHTGPVELQLDRASDLVLASQFAGGEGGALFEYELIYYPLTTDDGTAEGLKLPQPDAVVGTALTDLGDDAESYRWNFLSEDDDYAPLIELCRRVGTGEAASVIDVDQWLRAFAFATLSGAVDNYGADGSQHNARFYVRPDDGKVLYFPHDLDFFGSSSMAVVGNSDLARLLQDDANLRAYYGHLNDIVERAYNADYLAPWCDRLDALLPDQDFAANCQFVADRASWVMSGSSDAVLTRFPPEDFAIATGGGADFSTPDLEVTLEGVGWIDVREIWTEGGTVPLSLDWIDERTWRVIVPLEAGPNELVLVARDLHGEIVGTDSIAVTSGGG